LFSKRRLPRVAVDLDDARVAAGLTLATAGLWLLFGVTGIAALMVLVGAYLTANGALGARR